ncbi:MAG: DUF2029 domain-containing protein [Sandaracinus sp.]|nr:DUF2029 domain-containing protein [Myxococcales bacterium]MCB9599674.1 DUF2029 domain-containing protein [Sandaracinus sp.]MCB9631103.1 DUF2029 domain-containing protein [Sandaracinus sp.]
MTSSPPRTPAPGALVVFVLVLLLAALDVVARWEPNTWINRDGRFYTNVNATLVESGSIEQSEFCASWYDGHQGWNHDLDASWSNVALGREGRRYPKHPVLMPLLSTPFFWAFGVLGTLLFNLLAFATAGGFAYLLARRHASPSAAALAAAAFLLATGIRDYAYDYHVDILLLALFLGGLAALQRGRGFLGGLLIAACVTLKPTLLLWVPSIALFVEPAIRAHLASEPAKAPKPAKPPTRWRTLGLAVLGGAIVLGLFALANTWFFGRPWWAGYNRVLVVVAGEPQVADVSNTFDVPWDTGLEQLWSGPHGIRNRMALGLYALPALALLWRSPRLVIAALYALVTGVLLFARYRWYADRFLWPAFALLVPALAVLVDRAPAALRALRRRPPGPALGVGLAFALVATATLPGGGPVEHRVPRDVWSIGAMALAEGSFEVEPGAHAIEVDGRHVAAQSPLATIVAAPFASFGSYGLLALHVLLAGLLGAGLARLARTSEPRAVGPSAALAPALFVLAPGMAAHLLDGGSELLACALGFGGLALAPRRPFVGGLATGLAMFVGSAPWPFPIAALLIVRDGRARLLGGAVLAMAITLGLHVAIAGTWVTWSPPTPHPMPGWWMVLSAMALLGALVSTPRTFGLAFVLGLGAFWPGARLDLIPPAAFVLTAAPLVRESARWASRWRETSKRARVASVLAIAVALVATGAWPRLAEAGEPLRLATYRGLRSAKVKLGETPCDFLNWQHMVWECSTKDRGVFGMVGLPVSLPVLVASEPRELLRIPNQGPWSRRVTWEDVPATESFVLRWAVPDEVQARGAVLKVRIGDVERSLELPQPDGRVHVERIDTSTLVGRTVDVELKLEGREATVAVDGGFVRR